MLGSVYKRGEMWWIKLYYKGTPYYTSSKSLRKRDAQKLLQMYLGEIAQGTFTGLKTKKTSLTVSELLHDFECDCEQRGIRAMDRVRSRRRKLRAELGNLEVEHLTERRIDLYIKKRLEVVSTTTVNRETQMLGQALKLAKRKKRINTELPHIERFREANAREIFFEQHEFNAILPYLPEDITD